MKSCLAAHCERAEGIQQYGHAREQEDVQWGKQGLQLSWWRWRPRQRPRLDEPAFVTGS